MTAPRPTEVGHTAGSLELSSDPAEFARLVAEHQDKLCNFLLRYTRNRQDAEDLTQDTFVKAFKNLHRYERRYSFSAWLYTIARRTAYNHYRDRRPTEVLDFDVACASESPTDAVDRQEETHSVWAQVRQLKSPYQEVIVLKYLEEMSIEDIARVLGRTQTGVKILLFRARHQLRKLQTNLTPSS
ncbi:MAG TPA: sigma-70 family RNA polymerase sigma factor [Opitutaceae bacterium]|nr:sigma-70 family RNA polymerase sigma factor [Opitutaceae bacterium]